MTLFEMRRTKLNKTKQLILELDLTNQKIATLTGISQKLKQELKENFTMPNKVRPATNDDLKIGTVFWVPESKSILIADMTFISFADFSNHSFDGFFVEYE